MSRRDLLRANADLLLAALLAAAGVAGSFLAADGGWRWVGTVALIGIVPGYSLVSAFFPRTPSTSHHVGALPPPPWTGGPHRTGGPDWLERVVLAAALTLVVELILNYGLAVAIDRYSFHGTIVALGVASWAGLTISMWRRRNYVSDWITEWSHLAAAARAHRKGAAYALLCLLAFGALFAGWAILREGPATSFAVLDSRGRVVEAVDLVEPGQEQTFGLRIESHEPRPSSFGVRLMQTDANGSAVSNASFGPFHIQSGDIVRTEIRFLVNESATSVALTLHRDDEAAPYRTLFFHYGVPAAT